MGSFLEISCKFNLKLTSSTAKYRQFKSMWSNPAEQRHTVFHRCGGGLLLSPVQDAVWTWGVSRGGCVRRYNSYQTDLLYNIVINNIIQDHSYAEGPGWYCFLSGLQADLHRCLHWSLLTPSSTPSSYRGSLASVYRHTPAIGSPAT